MERSGVALFEIDGHLRTLSEIEADVIRLAVCFYGGRMTEAARHLRIGRSTLYRKLSELGLAGIEVPQPGPKEAVSEDRPPSNGQLPESAAVGA